MRWLKEFLNPKFKCERIGHKPIHITDSRIENQSESFRAIADEVDYDVTVCRRCGLEMERKEIGRNSIQKLTLPSDQMRLLKTRGWISN